MHVSTNVHMHVVHVCVHVYSVMMPLATNSKYNQCSWMYENKMSTVYVTIY